MHIPQVETPDVDRRNLLKGAACSGLAAGMLSALASPALAKDAAVVGSAAETALTELQTTLDELEAAFATPAWGLRTPQEFAEARRALLHNLMHGLEAWLEADPKRPFFTSFINQHKKLLGDNPDARYFSAVIDASQSYRIRGNLAGATYTSFTIEMSAGADDSGIGSTLNDTQFKADANGEFEIIVSREKHPGNWLPLPEGASSITSRHYYERKQSINRDRLHHIPLDITNLAPVPPRAAPDDAEIAAGIRRVATFVRGSTIPATQGMDLPWVSRVPNQFKPPASNVSNENITYAAKDNVYSMAPFLLMPDQALVMRGRFPKCRFANVVLFNRFLQTLNYEERTVSLNRAQTTLQDDGSFEMILAHRNPGHANWLDTEGRPFGIIFWRFQLPEEALTPLETELITLPA